MPSYKKALAGYYGFLLNGDFDSLKNLFSGEPSVNTPLEGRVQGRGAFSYYVREQQKRLKGYNARIKVGNITADDNHTVCEFVLYLKDAGELIDLPVLAVAECNGTGASGIRIYHSTKPLSGKKSVRQPFLMPTAGPEMPVVIKDYMDGIGKPDIEKVLGLFEENAYVRESSGEHCRHRGTSARRKYYENALVSGGISLKHCATTFNGSRFVVEYICDGMGGREIPSQAGATVYEIGMSKKLSAVRIYDDF